MSNEFTFKEASLALNYIEKGDLDEARNLLDYCEKSGTTSAFCSGLFLLAKGFMDYKLKIFHVALDNFNKAYDKFEECSVNEYSDINYWICESLIMALKSSIRSTEEPEHFKYGYIDKITKYRSPNDKYLDRANFVIKGNLHNWIDDTRYC